MANMALVVSNSGNALIPALSNINNIGMNVGVVALLTVALKALGALAAMPLHTPQSQDQTGPSTRGWMPETPAALDEALQNYPNDINSPPLTLNSEVFQRILENYNNYRATELLEEKSAYAEIIKSGIDDFIWRNNPGAGSPSFIVYQNGIVGSIQIVDPIQTVERLFDKLFNQESLFIQGTLCSPNPHAPSSQPVALNNQTRAEVIRQIERFCGVDTQQATTLLLNTMAMLKPFIDTCQGSDDKQVNSFEILQDIVKTLFGTVVPIKQMQTMIEPLMSALSGVNWHSQIGYLSECLKEIMKTTTTTPAPTTTPVPPIPGTTSHVEICHIGQSVDGPPPSIPRATMQFIQVFCGVTPEQAEAIATIITVALNATLTQCTLQELGSSSKSLRDLEYVVKQSLQMLGKWPFDAKQMGNPFPLDVIVNILDPMMTSLLPYWREFIVSLVMCIDQQHPHSPGITSYGATPSPPHVSTLASSYATQGSSMAMMTMMINDRSKPDPTIPGYLVTSSNTTNVSSLLGTAGQEGNEKMDTTWTRLNEKIDAVTMGLGVGLGIPLGLGLITIAILLYRLVTAQQAGELAEVTAGGQETGTTSTKKPTVIATLVFA